MQRGSSIFPNKHITVDNHIPYKGCVTFIPTYFDNNVSHLSHSTYQENKLLMERKTEKVMQCHPNSFFMITTLVLYFSDRNLCHHNY